MNPDDRTRIWLGRTLAAASVLLSAGALLAVLVTDPRVLVDHFDVNALGVLGFGFGTLAWLTIANQPRNGAVWALVVSGFIASVVTVSELTVTLLIRQSRPGFSFGDPGDLSMSDLSVLEQWIGYPAASAWPVAFLVPLTLGLMLFPDGRAPSPRWKWLGWSNAITIALVTSASAWLFRPGSTLPMETRLAELPGVAGFISTTGISLLLIGSALSAIALVVRYRRSAGDARRQIRWVAWGGAALFLAVLVAVVAAFAIEGNLDAPNTVIDDAIFIGGEVLLILSFAVAISKYRLYDIDVVISRTVALTSLAIVIGALYGGAVLTFVLLFGDDNQRGGDLGLALPLGATVVVAVAFEPLRVRLQRWANRLVYGNRAAPTEVLTRLTAQLSDTSTGEGLAGLARLLREGTGADVAAVWLRVRDRLRVEASSPADALSTFADVASADQLPKSETELSVPVRRGEELLGALGVTKPRAHPVGPADEDLLTDVAAGAGLLLRNLQLNAELADRALQLQASRRRLIAAQDDARHRLERDLHDGAQQQVVALKVKLGLAQTVAEREGAVDLSARLASLAAETQDAVDAMRLVARGIYPPLLEAEGLGPALAATGRFLQLPLRLVSEDLPRYARPVEETVYFCVLAALNRAKLAGASSAQARVEGDALSLQATVTYDVDDPTADFTAVTDRIDAFGGAVTTAVSSHTTTVTMQLPTANEVLEPV